MTLFTPLSGLTSPERVRFGYVALGFMCVASAALVARTVGDTLFLSTYSAGLLSYMYIATALVVSTAAYAYGALTGRIPIGRLIVLTCGGLILLLLGLRVALASPFQEFRIVAYLLSDLVVNIPMMLFWSFAALVFDPREAKRLFGFVGACGTFACILVGFVVRPFTLHLGTSNLLVLVALLIGGFLVSVARLSRLEAGRLQPVDSGGGTGRRPSQMGYYIGLLKTWQVRNLALLMLTATFALTLIDYQFKAGARDAYPGDQLAGFFGSFYASASVLSLLIQLFLVHLILQKGGVLPGLLILPAGVLITSLGTAVTASFSWMVATKFVAQIFLFTVDTAALQMLYLGIQKQSRNQARTFVEGIGKPVSMAATGVALVGLSQILPLHTLAVGGAAAALLWLFLAHSNTRAYVSALVDSIGAHRFDLSEETSTFHDKAFETHMRQALASASGAEISHLLGILPEIDRVDWTPEFRTLLQQERPEIKIASIQYLQKAGDESDLDAILDHCRHPAPEVRTAAIHAISALDNQDVVGEIEMGLQDGHPAVRAAAVAGLINSGDLDSLLNGGVVLKEMLKSDSAQDRVAAAEALDHIESGGLIRPLIGLLQDSDETVVRAALEACKDHPDPRLVPEVLPLLAEPSVAPAAADTLVTFGSGVLDHLIPYLELSQMESAFAGAHRIPALLATIGDPKALPVLLKASGAPDPNVQKESVQAYARLLRCVPSIKPHLSDLERTIGNVLAAAETYRRILQEVTPLGDTVILCDALRQAYNSQLQSAFILLDVTTPGVNMQAIYLNLTGGASESRANALEILDNVLKGDVKSSLLELLESSEPLHTGTRETAAFRVADLIREGATDWVSIGALYAAAANRLEIVPDAVRQYLTHPNPTVRETALYAFGELGEPRDLLDTCAELAEDPDPGVRRLAKSLSTA